MNRDEADKDLHNALKQLVDGLSQSEVELVVALSSAFTGTVIKHMIPPDRAIDIFRKMVDIYEEVSIAARLGKRW